MRPAEVPPAEDTAGGEGEEEEAGRKEEGQQGEGEAGKQQQRRHTQVERRAREAQLDARRRA